MKDYIVVIGAGLAGCEAAYQIANRGIKVKLYEMKPEKYSDAHCNANFAEIVCSNSFKSNLHTSGCGLLKEELRLLGSLLIHVADMTSVPAGQALAVDRDIFSKEVTSKIEKNSNIEIIKSEVGKNSLRLQEVSDNAITIIATGPLTSENMVEEIKNITGDNQLYFYDAAAPIVTKDSIDFSIAFWGDRYGKGDSNYINLPMNKEEYDRFLTEIINAQIVTLHDFEKREIFEGCMPVEVMAKRGADTLRFGPLKPVGFTDPRTDKRPYAIVQLRQDDKEGSIFNLVGFQTNLKFSEQKRVFSLIPGLQNAEFVKYGVMHRNTYINSSKLLDNTYCMKNDEKIYFAGQITGVEGYVESISSGMIAGINAANKYEKKAKQTFSNKTMMGAITDYISTENDKFQPMNANFGILPKLEETIKDKRIRYEMLADRAIYEIKDLHKM